MMVETMLAELRDGEIVTLHVSERVVFLNVMNLSRGVEKQISAEVLPGAESDIFAETFRRALDEVRGVV